MKKLIIVLLCFVSAAAFAQEPTQVHIYSKVFRLNNSTRYITNMPAVRGLAFFFHEAADTNTMVMYIPDFKASDIQVFEGKDEDVQFQIMPSQLCQPARRFYLLLHSGRWTCLLLPPAARRTTGRNLKPMKKIFVIMLLVCSCTKAKEKVSDEVTVSVLNQCTATITFYDNYRRINTQKTYSIANMFLF